MKNLLSLILFVSFATASCSVAPAKENVDSQETRTEETKNPVVESTASKIRFYAAAAVALFGAVGLVVFRNEVYNEIAGGMPATQGAFSNGAAAAGDVLKNAWARTASFFESQAEAPAAAHGEEAQTGHVHGPDCSDNHPHQDAFSVDSSNEEVAEDEAASKGAPTKKKRH